MKKEKEKVTILHIKNFPLDLHKKLKVQAAQEGSTIKDVSIKILSKGVDR